MIDSEGQLSLSSATRLLQWREYESIDWDVVFSHSNTSMANSFCIRKGLIRKVSSIH